MNTAKKILFIIAVPSSILGALVLLGLTIAFFIFGSPAFTDAIIEGLANGTIETTFVGTAEEQAAAIQLMFNIMAGCYIPFSLLLVVNAILSGLAINKDSKALYIANIVFGAMYSGGVNLIGGIFGLIDLGMKARREAAPKAE